MRILVGIFTYIYLYEGDTGNLLTSCSVWGIWVQGTMKWLYTLMVNHLRSSTPSLLNFHLPRSILSTFNDRSDSMQVDRWGNVASTGGVVALKLIFLCWCRSASADHMVLTVCAATRLHTLSYMSALTGFTHSPKMEKRIITRSSLLLFYIEDPELQSMGDRLQSDRCG